MAGKKLNSSELYFNRELSWLKFNYRVLKQGFRKELPLGEKLKFLAIFSSNLDEFFMIRVAGLMQQKSAGIRKRDISGMTPNQQLSAISREVHHLVDKQDKGVESALSELQNHGVFILKPEKWTPDQREFVKNFFNDEIMPVLTPLAMNKLDPPPILQGRQLNIAVTVIQDKTDNPEKQVIVIPIPGLLNRFVRIPAEKDFNLVMLEDVIAQNISSICPAEKIADVSCFRITRDADVGMQEDEAADLLETIEQAIIERQRGSTVRLELAANACEYSIKWLCEWLGVAPDNIYRINSLVDATCLFKLAATEPVANLKIPDWPACEPVDLLDCEDLWQTIREKDVLLFHPYESYDPVVKFVREAAEDPDVIVIKQTLYRTSSDSPIIKALAQAAENGKEVIVLVELKARFDEAQNVNWAKILEDAGCHVIYGIARLKTHAKAILIIRREETRIRRYVHLATGNYNDKTAKMYSDIGMFTSKSSIASDVSAFFNLLTGMSETVGWKELVIAPTDMRQRFIDFIDREIQASSPDRPGLIMVKVNSLQDKEIIKALYRASQAGVMIKLNVRGICCLRPGLKGVSENIEVCSIVDRYLEHARIFYFRNGGHEEIYLSSADWMRRNLDRRLEILFPVKEDRLKKRLIEILQVYFLDNTQSEKLLKDGSYELNDLKGQKIRAQEYFYNVIKDEVKTNKKSSLRFKPMRKI